MKPKFLDFPNADEWKEIEETSPFGKIFQIVDQLAEERINSDGINSFLQTIELRNLAKNEIQTRIIDVQWSFVFTMFYYKKGIPDSRWFISPGRNGASIEYFPDFEPKHHVIKGWFDFYSDIFYYKLFSAWDLIGHYWNIQYDMKITKVDFKKALKELQKRNPILSQNISEIQETIVFKKANKIRNDITHNYLPSTVGVSVNRDSNSSAVGVKPYTPSNEIAANMYEILELFISTLQYMLPKK